MMIFLPPVLLLMIVVVSVAVVVVVVVVVMVVVMVVVVGVIVVGVSLMVFLFSLIAFPNSSSPYPELIARLVHGHVMASSQSCRLESDVFLDSFQKTKNISNLLSFQWAPISGQLKAVMELCCMPRCHLLFSVRTRFENDLVPITLPLVPIFTPLNSDMQRMVNLGVATSIWMHPRHLSELMGIPLLFLSLIHLIRILYDIRLAVSLSERDVTSPLVDDDLDEEEAIRATEKKNLENVVEDETLEIDEIVNIKESRNHPLENVIGNLN
ncbi:hypothetical protein Tco_0831813 [Tanacetum coccineum]